MSDIVGYDLTPDSGTTLRKVLKQNLTPYLDQFESISVAASKVSAYILLNTQFNIFLHYHVLQWSSLAGLIKSITANPLWWHDILALF